MRPLAPNNGNTRVLAGISIIGGGESHSVAFAWTRKGVASFPFLSIFNPLFEIRTQVRLN